MSQGTRAPEEVRVSNLRFLREQDGVPERLLKSRLAEMFAQHSGVQRAYLAQISSGGQHGVALCIKSGGGADLNLVQDIGVIFASIFGAHEHLDILFLSNEQQVLLEQVCPPFLEGRYRNRASVE